MNSKKFFELAKENGINDCELVYTKNNSLSISLFHRKISNYSISNSSKLEARGIFNNKAGFCSTENIDSSSFNYLINGIKETAKLIETNEEPIIFKGSEKYYKKNVFSKALEAWDVNDILAKLHKLEDKLRDCDPRVSEVTVDFSKDETETVFKNSFGLNLKQKNNSFLVVASLVMKVDEEVKDDYSFVLSSNPDDFNIDLLVEQVKEKVSAKFNGKTIKNGKYKAVLKRNVVSSFIKAICDSLSAEEIQKHSSHLEGKLHQKVFSSKLTVKDLPLNKNLFFKYFDDEGVATYNKTLIKNGVIETYLYNLTTAKKDNTVSTGNASGRGSRIGISFLNLFVSNGKSSLNDLFEKIQNGVYITSIQGLHAGLNSNSGDFSLQAEGFLIEDGKIISPLTLITVSGNLFKLFNEIIAVGNDSETSFSAVTSPSIAFKNIMVSAS